MNRAQHRFLLTATAGIAALVLSAAPALAGSDGCSGDCDEENTPTPLLQVVPTPVAPDSLAGNHPAQRQVAPKARRVSVRVTGTSRTMRVTGPSRTVPHGAVAAGAGGTAPHGADGLLALLVGGLALTAAGGGLVTAGRRASS